MGPFEKDGKYRKWKRPRKTVLSDDEFSKELSNQGEEGKFMRLLYLNSWVKIYRHKVQDEPLLD